MQPTAAKENRLLAIDQLSTYPNWVCGRADKSPVDPKTGKDAKANNPQTWGTFDQALSYLEAHKNNSIKTMGFEVGESPFIATDLDHCRDPETGVVEPWAREVVDTLSSYTETSPSGTGIRIFVTVPDFPKINRKRGGLGPSGKGAIEIANTGKYFSITGNHLEGTPDWICANPEGLQRIVNQYFPPKTILEVVSMPKKTVTLEDEEIIRKAENARNGAAFKKLYAGDWSDYPSQSETDLALCSMLAFWCGNDPEQIDRIFRGSGLMRPKWEREDYRAQTIVKAIEGTIETYTPQKKTDTKSLLDFNLTDAGNAECFAQRYRDEYAFVPEKKEWFYFNGIRFVEDRRSVLKMLETIRTRAKEAVNLRAADPELNSERTKSIIKWCLSSESRLKLSAALSIAEPMMSESITRFDSDPRLLCCTNGAVDLRNGRLFTPAKEDYLTKSVSTPYDPGATSPKWIKFLGDIFAHDGNIIDFVQKAVGYSLTGLTTEQVLFILYGTGANGKSVFLNIVGDLLGDYSITTPAATFKDSPHDSIPNDIARMTGARLVRTIEAKEGTRLNEERVKSLTGGDKIAARFLHNEWFEFTPVCKYWLAVNHKPIIRGSDEAIWRRIRLIPFEVYFQPKDRDPNLYETLKGELPGILTWAVEGCLKWQREGLEPTGKVKEWTNTYRAESDLIAQFLEEKTQERGTGKVQATTLYQAYESWCKDHGEYCITGTMFGKRLQEKGFIKKKEGCFYYLGLELI